MNYLSRSFRALAKSPYLLGLSATFGFYALIHGGPLKYEMLERYLTRHPVEYMETLLFAVGLAGLIVKGFEIAAQRSAFRRPLLASDAPPRDPVGESDAQLQRLDRLPDPRQGEYYVQRLRSALEHVGRRGSAEWLDEELKYLADVDAARLQAGYGLFRVIVWAIPILGFLGTVIGITTALNGVDLQAPDQSMYEVLSGLGLKFDTTALALLLSIILMFLHYAVERAESHLLEQVDRRVRDEMSDRFPMIASGIDGSWAAANRAAEKMIQTSEAIARRQAELWRASVESAAEQWEKMTEKAAEHVRGALASTSGDLARRAEALQRAVEAAGEIARLEDALNRNLAALAGAKHFEQTALSLAAAVNMLGARLTETARPAATIQLEAARRASHAA